MQTRSRPPITVLIWSLTNNIAPEAYLGGHCAMSPPLLTLPFSKKEQWCQVTEMCQALLMAFVPYG